MRTVTSSWNVTPLVICTKDIKFRQKGHVKCSLDDEMSRFNLFVIVFMLESQTLSFAVILTYKYCRENNVTRRKGEQICQNTLLLDFVKSLFFVIYLRRSTLYNKTGFQYVSLLLSSKADFDDRLATVIPQLLGEKKKEKEKWYIFLIRPRGMDLCSRRISSS